MIGVGGVKCSISFLLALLFTCTPSHRRIRIQPLTHTCSSIHHPSGQKLQKLAGPAAKFGRNLTCRLLHMVNHLSLISRQSSWLPCDLV
ncbi:hypothetical protein K450DRAFT_221698 [Umbelopsis ramanniana AG]|uniref:Secreted protein n=1 Tax=Umbelopsis ramanniana AG TaxID=1314678 RepID=A0AAD5EJK6_UMBRA|nr:uncharacterized protein K450DRAFT_221698 [Umbelopsis ramanniana AG]KAI8583555.1 hypothetical protein K450DRAFT_221698 [Umbelopsis ramanniana AG]